MIHPTAIVESGARLADDVRIGPYAYVSGHAVLEAGVCIDGSAMIVGRTTLAEGVRVWPHAVIGAEPQDWSYKGEASEVRIGPRTQLREHVTVHRATKEGGATVVGADCMLMAGSHVAHDCTVGNRVMLANGSLLAGHVTLHDGVVIAGNSAIHQFVTIGRLSMLGGMRRAVRDIPPFMLVNGEDAINGINVVGLKRAGIDEPARRELVRFVRGLRTSPEPLVRQVARWQPEHPEGVELREAMLNPRRRGWMPFARRER